MIRLRKHVGNRDSDANGDNFEDNDVDGKT